MSKSVGNVVDPLPIIDQYGSDSLRLSLVVGSTPGNDVNFSEEKTKYYWRFVNKLWNASRFVAMTVADSKIPYDMGALQKQILKNGAELHDFDLWILHTLHDTIDDCEKFFRKFYLGECAHRVVQVVWQFFFDWYIEISKIQVSA